METSFLEHEPPNADLKASEIVSAHKAEIDSILSGISDIIHLDTYTLDDYADKMGDAQKTRRDTITAVDTLDESLTAEYQNLESLDNAVLSKYSVLMQATSNGKSASPMYYDKKPSTAMKSTKASRRQKNRERTILTQKPSRPKQDGFRKRLKKKPINHGTKKHGTASATLPAKSPAIMIIKKRPKALIQ